MVKTIAETAWHHEGDFKFMLDLVNNVCSNLNADIIKLHLSLDYDEYFSKDHPAYDIIPDKNLNQEQWVKIIEIIKKSNKNLMLLTNDRKAFDFGNSFEPDFIEIHSVCLNDLKLLAHIRKNISKIPVVIGIGGSSLYEIENAINYLKAKDNSQEIILMHGFQNYPTKYEDINFNKIRKIIKLYPNYQHGYADHTAWDEPNNILISTMGAALGMNFIEKHITTQPGKERTDWQAAIGFMEFNQLAANISLLNKCNGDGNLALNKGEKAYSVFGPMKKAAILKRNVKKGEVLSENCIDLKRTKNISNLSQLAIIESFGKVFSNDLPEGHCLMESDLS